MVSVVLANESKQVMLALAEKIAYADGTSIS